MSINRSQARMAIIRKTDDHLGLGHDNRH